MEGEIKTSEATHKDLKYKRTGKLQRKWLKTWPLLRAVSVFIYLNAVM